MKHIQTYILLAGLLLGSHASAQTTLYKTYVGRTGIKASCIENYPIGNGLKVTVTMLEANDSVSFHHLTKSLKALPYSGTKSERTNDSVDYYPLKKSINKPLRDYVHELDSTPEFSHVTTLEGSIATAFLGQMKRKRQYKSLVKAGKDTAHLLSRRRPVAWRQGCVSDLFLRRHDDRAGVSLPQRRGICPVGEVCAENNR